MAEDAAARGREILDAGRYMTLATADADGVPWASPVWYSVESPGALLWMSTPDARHSQNLEARPRLSIVIFDSGQAPGKGNAVYIEASAETVPDAELEQAVAVYSDSSLKRGAEATSLEDVRPPQPWRLYRATISRAFFGEENERTEISLG